MFEKRKLEKVRVVLHNLFANQFRFADCTVASGFIKDGKKYAGAYVKVKKMNETLLRELGESGEIRLAYRLDKTLALRLTFSCTEGDEDYELVHNFFYDYEDDDDEEDEEFIAYHELNLTNYTDDKLTDITYTVKDVARDAVAKRSDRLLEYVLNICDVYLENLLEEYGEE